MFRKIEKRLFILLSALQWERGTRTFAGILDCRGKHLTRQEKSQSFDWLIIIWWRG